MKRNGTRWAALAGALAIVWALGFNHVIWGAEPVHLPSTTHEPVVKLEGPAMGESLKNPIPGIKWGFDLRVRYEDYDNAHTLADGVDASHVSMFRIRPRIWTSLSPWETVTFNARLISEPRYNWHPTAAEGWSFEEGLFDLFNLQLTNLPVQNLRVIVGRQEMTLGNKWLVFDATTTDGTRSEFFDAARLTYEAKEIQTTFDGIYILQYAELDKWLPVISDLNRPIAEQDERTAIFYVSNKSLPRTQLDGYLMYRHQEEPIGARGNEGHTWLAGGRVSGQVGNRWEYRAEFAPEWGTLNGRDLEAWGFNSLITYNAGGQWKHKFRAGYEFLSGDDPATETNEGWDPMYARRALWSEIAVVLWSLENRGRSADYKNLQRPSVGWSAKPLKWVDISADYMPLFANENTLAGVPGYSETGRFRGHYAQAISRFTLSRYWSGMLWAEAFWPGDYYTPNARDTAFFFRGEIMFKF